MDRERLPVGATHYVPPKKRTTEPTRLETLGSLALKLAALTHMSVNELREAYATAFGVPTQSRNGDWLRRELARRLQEQAEGGLSGRAEMRIRELGDALPTRWRRRLTKSEAKFVDETTARDPRLPPPGTEIKRAYKGKTYTVTVRHHDFDFNGTSYETLSKVARAITGSNWNGFEFFKLAK
jgi:hypothetical protein